MKFIVEIPDENVKSGVRDRERTAGSLTPETLIKWSLEENFGIPGANTIKVAVYKPTRYKRGSLKA